MYSKKHPCVIIADGCLLLQKESSLHPFSQCRSKLFTSEGPRPSAFLMPRTHQLLARLSANRRRTDSKAQLSLSAHLVLNDCVEQQRQQGSSDNDDNGNDNDNDNDNENDNDNDNDADNDNRSKNQEVIGGSSTAL